MNQEQLIQQYINHEMTESQATEFEIAYLSDPHLIEQIELAKALKDGLHALEEEDDSQTEIQEPPSNTVPFYRKSVPAWSLAAVFLVGLLPFFTMQGNPPSSLPALNVIPISVATTRGNSDIPNLMASASEQTVISTYVDSQFTALPNSYSYTLVSVDNDKLRKQVGLQPNAEDMLYLNIGEVPAGRYQLTLYRHESNRQTDGAIIYQTTMTVRE